MFGWAESRDDDRRKRYFVRLSVWIVWGPGPSSAATKMWMIDGFKSMSSSAVHRGPFCPSNRPSDRRWGRGIADSSSTTTLSSILPSKRLYSVTGNVLWGIERCIFYQIFLWRNIQK
jgi:hypothetical protein